VLLLIGPAQVDVNGVDWQIGASAGINNGCAPPFYDCAFPRIDIISGISINILMSNRVPSGNLPREKHTHSERERERERERDIKCCETTRLPKARVIYTPAHALLRVSCLQTSVIRVHRDIYGGKKKARLLEMFTR